MAAVDADAVARNVGRREERQPHDVVPVHVGHEDVIGLRRRRTVARERRLPERAHAAAEIAEHVVGPAGLDLDAGRVAAVGSGHRRTRGRRRSARASASDAKVRPDAPRSAATIFWRTAGGGERDRQRAARAPEADALHRAAGGCAASKAASAGAGKLLDGAAHRRKHAEHAIEAADREDLRDDRLQVRRRRSCAPARAQLLRRDHQDPQADAADVVDAGEIQHQRPSAAAGRLHERRQRGLELRGALVVDAADRRGNDDVGELAAGGFHRGSGALGARIIAPLPENCTRPCRCREPSENRTSNPAPDALAERQHHGSTEVISMKTAPDQLPPSFTPGKP